MGFAAFVLSVLFLLFMGSAITALLVYSFEL